MARYKRCVLIWFLVSLDLRFLIDEHWIFSNLVQISDFWILSSCIEKYKPALSMLDSSRDNSYCVILVIVLLDVNVGRLHFLVSENSFLSWVFSNFSSDFLLWDICICWGSLLRLLIVLRRSLLRTDKASLFETLRSLKIRNFGYTPSCLQLFRKIDV